MSEENLKAHWASKFLVVVEQLIVLNAYWYSFFEQMCYGRFFRLPLTGSYIRRLQALPQAQHKACK
jgi:hypothetical protein